MIYRNVDGNICEIKKTDVPNDSLYYKKIYENMLKIRKSADNGKNTDNGKSANNSKSANNGKSAKREKQKSPLKKAFQNKEKKQSKEKSKNIAASEVDV